MEIRRVRKGLRRRAERHGLDLRGMKGEIIMEPRSTPPCCDVKLDHLISLGKTKTSRYMFYRDEIQTIPLLEEKVNKFARKEET